MARDFSALNKHAHREYKFVQADSYRQVTQTYGTGETHAQATGAATRQKEPGAQRSGHAGGPKNPEPKRALAVTRAQLKAPTLEIREFIHGLFLDLAANQVMNREPPLLCLQDLH